MVENEVPPDPEDEAAFDNETIDERSDDGDLLNDEHDADIEQLMDERYGERMAEYNLRPRRPRDYGHLHAVLEETVMTQHGIKKGLKLFGDAGVTAVLKELQQLHDRDVIEPMLAASLSSEEKQGALPYLMFLKKKRSGIIKGRGCADGRKQRVYTTKEEASSPTVSIESVFLSCAIDAAEGRDVGTVDLPGAFMQADMDDTVYMKLEGKMVELLVRIDPDRYECHVRIINGKPVLYVRLKKALYGTLKAALLFWRLLSAQLQEWGFVLNDYDSCVANKIINGSQCTIIWHVDNLKISHVDSDVVSAVIEQLSSVFVSAYFYMSDTVLMPTAHSRLAFTIVRVPS
jgi:hypothetical protein